MKTSTLGRLGEDRAAAYVTDLGWQVVARNWRCRFGELDMVCLEGDSLVFVEVKTRGSLRAGHPLEAIGYRKLSAVRGLAIRWLQAQERWYPRFRIDVIGILWNRGDPQITHVRNAQ